MMTLLIFFKFKMSPTTRLIQSKTSFFANFFMQLYGLVRKICQKILVQAAAGRKFIEFLTEVDFNRMREFPKYCDIVPIPVPIREEKLGTSGE